MQQAMQLHLGVLCSWRPQSEVQQHVLDDLQQMKRWASARLLMSTQLQLATSALQQSSHHTCRDASKWCMQAVHLIQELW